MPRLSLYRPEKSKDFKFFDRTIYEMFQVGGVDVYVHKYKGTETVDENGNVTAKDFTQIQDFIFLENRDRKYEADVYVIRGHYQAQDTDFNLSQFGLFLQNDTVFMTVHINNSVDLLGRKIMAGDVFELPNLREEYTFDRNDIDNFAKAIKKYYVVEEINRAAEGFSATWYPHLYRIKLKPIVDSQEFKDLLDRPENEDNFAGDYDPNKDYYPGQIVKYQGTLYEVQQPIIGNTVMAPNTSVAPPDATYYSVSQVETLREIVSTYTRESEINQAIVDEAEADAPKSGFETSHYYTLAVDPTTGRAAINTVDVTTTDSSVDDASDTSLVSEISPQPVRDGYKGYLLEDGIPPNAETTVQYGFGIRFPNTANIGDTFLRTDYLPNRLFRFDGARWVKLEDNVRMTLTNTDTRQTFKTSFINNNELSGLTRLTSDVFNILDNGVPSFETGANIPTTDVQIVAGKIVVLTNINYAAGLRAEIWLDEAVKVTDVTNYNNNGKLKFQINAEIRNGTRVDYSIYETAVQQRQALSKALRIKPTADE